MIAEFLNKLDVWWFGFKDWVLSPVEKELVLILRNIRTAPQEVPLSFWTLVVFIVYFVIKKWRKRWGR